MATLEKIRSKSVLLLVIIGAALLAFIIGDFFTSGRTLFGSGTTIAKVDGQKIDVQEFQRRVQEAQQQMQGQRQQMDASVLQQQVLDGMVAERLFLQEVKDLGLTVTDQELTEVMVGKNSQYVDNMVRQQYGAPDAATFHDMAFNPGKYNMQLPQAQQLQQMWVEMEKNVEEMLLQQKFQRLFMGTLVANDLDARAIYDENAATSHIAYAKKDFSTLKDEDFEVSEDEIRALYDQEKGRYTMDEPRRIASYISVPIVPSHDDILAGQKKVEDALMALNEKPELAGLADMPEFVSERTKMTQESVDRQARLKAALDTLAPGRAAIVAKNGNDYQLVKLFGKGAEVDKVKVDFLAVQGTKTQVDSLVALLNSGASIDSVASSPLVAQNQQELEISLVDAAYAPVKELLEGRAQGVYFTPDTAAAAQGGRIFRIVERTAPVTVYDVANVSFTVEPSATTVNNLEADLAAYVRDHNNAKAFVDSAQSAGYTTFPAVVTASTPSISNLRDSHSAVAWVMDNDKGDVSPIFGDQQTGNFLAVAVTDIYDGDYVPMRDTQLHSTLATKARNNKKAAKLLADYQGKGNDVASYAQAMGTEVDTTTVNFGQYMIPRLGVGESAVMGAVCAAKPGELVGPMQAANSVIVFTVTTVDTEGRPFDLKESQMRYNQQRGAQRLGGRMDRILRGNKKVTNNINSFYK